MKADIKMYNAYDKKWEWIKGVVHNCIGADCNVSLLREGGSTVPLGNIPKTRVKIKKWKW